MIFLHSISQEIVQAIGKPLLILDIPLHVTGIWHIVWGRDLTDSGSIGAGLVIRPGLKVLIYTSKRDLTILNGKILNLPHQVLVKKLLGSARDLAFICECPVNVGLGYGLSAALTIAYSIGYGLGKCDLKQCLDVAHVVEVKLMTGLGDVIAEIAGGDLEIREKAGAPSIGKVCKVVEKIPVITVHVPQLADTRQMLREMYTRIQSCSIKYIRKLLEERTVDTFLQIACEFSREVGFLEKVRDLVKELNVKLRGYYAKKNLLVLVPEWDQIEDVVTYLQQRGVDFRIFYTSSQGLKVEISSLA